MVLYKVVHSHAVQRFQDRILDIKELTAFDLFFGRLRKEPGGDGRKEHTHRGHRRNLHFSYYVSSKLKTVFVLMAYQERLGEPRADDLKEEQILLSAIHLKESSHADSPEAP